MLHSVRPWAFFSALAVLVGTGCSEHRAPDNLAQAIQTGERPVAMKGTATYFGGKLAVTVTVSNGIGHGHAMGPGARGGGHKPSRAEMPDLSGMDNDEAMAYLRQKSAVGSPMPPVTMHLKIDNTGSGIVTVEVTDFMSDLGNFATTPSTLAVAPGQTAEPDPMISQLGVTSDDIPFTVTLKVDGKKETQKIDVRNIMAPGDPAVK